MRSKQGLALANLRSRVNAMPIEARCRIAAYSRRARSSSVTSRALMTRHSCASTMQRDADTSIVTREPDLVTNTQRIPDTSPRVRTASTSRSRSACECQMPNSMDVRPTTSSTE